MKINLKGFTFIFIYLMSLFFFSCSPQVDPETAFFEKSYEKDFNDIANKFCPFIKRKTVVVTDLVDLQTFLPKKEGLFLSEYLKSSLINVCKSKIVQVEFSKHFKMSNKGLRILTRNISELKKKSINTPLIITGTYKKTEDKVILFIRLINYKTGKIEKFVSKEIKFYKPYGLF